VDGNLILRLVETCGATRNFVTNSAFVLARRKTTENLDKDMNIHCN